MMFTYSKPLFGRATIRTVSTIAIVSMLAGYFTFFNQVKPSSAQMTSFDKTEVTFSDSRPSVTSNMKTTFSLQADIIPVCQAQPCAELYLIFPVDASNNPIFTLATSTANEITLDHGLAVYVDDQTFVPSITLGNNVAASGQRDMITIGLDTTSLTGLPSTFFSMDDYTLTYGGNNITNPSTADTVYPITVGLAVDTGNGIGPASDSGSTNVIFTDATTLSATVETTLSFTVTGVAASQEMGGEPSVTSTAATCPFGTLVPNTPKVCTQQLDIATNAPNGYAVSIVQTQDMTSALSDTIKQFPNGNQTSATFSQWEAPSVVGGHLGYSSDDLDVTFPGFYSGIPTMTANGVDTTAPLLSSAVATTGDTLHANYKIEINANQPAGTYSNIVMYLVTARY